MRINVKMGEEIIKINKIDVDGHVITLEIDSINPQHYSKKLWWREVKDYYQLMCDVAVLGTIEKKVKTPFGGRKAFLWHVRVMQTVHCRDENDKDIPVKGYAETLEKAKKIVETVWDNTCEWKQG